MKRSLFTTTSVFVLLLISSRVTWSQPATFYQCNPISTAQTASLPIGYGITAIEAATDYCESFEGDSYSGVDFPDNFPTVHSCVMPRKCHAFEKPCVGAVEAYHQKTQCMPIKEGGCPKNPAGNPCNVANGNKFQHYKDISDLALPLTRYYNSQSLISIGFGKGWRTNHHFNILPLYKSLAIIEPNGRGENWFKGGDDSWSGDADSKLTISENPEITTRFQTRFTVGLNKGGSQSYDPYGTLIESIDAHGNKKSYSYNGTNLASVTDHYGNSLTFFIKVVMLHA